MSEKKKLVIITGPTAAGKTDLAIELAKQADGEIISADSMQVYRGMDIGTAKVKPDEMQGVKHHLIDVLEPEQDFNVYTWAGMARDAIDDITSRGKLPIIAGGTGFYIRALLYDCDFVPEDSALSDTIRKKYEAVLAEKGAGYLHKILSEIDKRSAEMIHENNTKRVIRALEYHDLTGRLISQDNEKNRSKESPYDFLYFVIDMPRDELYARIEARVDEMIKEGLVDEVEALRDRGLKKSDNSMQAIGYRQILSYLDGECELEDAIEAIKTDTRHFAKRQLTWFRKEKETIWVSAEDGMMTIKKALEAL